MVRLTLASSTLLAGVAIAQQPNASFNASLIQQVGTEVGPTIRSQWCNAQFNSCGILCSGNPSQNNCDSTTLNFTCTCAANNSAPAEQYYVPTMISFICNQALGDCLKSTAGSQSQQQNCKNTIVCGQTNVSAVSSAAPSSQSATGTATATGSRSAGQATATATNSGSPGATPSKGAADAVKVGQEVKTGVLGAALFALFGLAL